MVLINNTLRASKNYYMRCAWKNVCDEKHLLWEKKQSTASIFSSTHHDEYPSLYILLWIYMYCIYIWICVFVKDYLYIYCRESVRISIQRTHFSHLRYKAPWNLVYSVTKLYSIRMYASDATCYTVWYILL